MVDEFEFFLDKAWSDGLPVVTPTEERVQRMLTGTQLHAEDVIGDIPPYAGARDRTHRGHPCGDGGM